MIDNNITARLRAWSADESTWDLLTEAADDIERMRDALRRISHAPHGKVYCADGHEEAVLIARVALEGEKKNDAAP
jgi:hypothetical protein